MLHQCFTDRYQRDNRKWTNIIGGAELSFRFTQTLDVVTRCTHIHLRSTES